MKNFILLIVLIALSSCSENKKTENSEKICLCDSVATMIVDSAGIKRIVREQHCDSFLLSERPKKIWVCDSIGEITFDSVGNQIMTAKPFCDSVLEKPRSK